MKTVLKFVGGYAIGALVVGFVVVSRGDSPENTFKLLISWLPMAVGYGALSVIVLRALKVANLPGILELCGLTVGFFPLLSGLWPTYSMRWDLALFIVSFQCVTLSLVAFVIFVAHRIVVWNKKRRGASGQ